MEGRRRCRSSSVVLLDHVPHITLGSDCAAFLTPGALGLYTKAPFGVANMMSHALTKSSRVVVVRSDPGGMSWAEGR